MKQTKTRLELFSFYDHRGIAAHLERQAQQGWLLEKIGSWGWKYRRSEPREVKFAVTYFPKASAYDPGPSEQERTLRDYCAEAGWILAASNAQMQVFYNEAPDPVPVETDAVVQVENIHAAAKRSHLASHWMLGVLGVFQMIVWLVQLFENPVGLLADYGGLFRGLCWLTVLVLSAVELVCYYRWHRKAEELAKESGVLHPTRSHRGLQSVCLFLIIGAFLLWVGSIQSGQMMTIVVLSYLYITVLITAVNGCRLLLKKLKVSKTVNRAVTIAVDVVLAFGMMGLLTWFVLNHNLGGREPVDTYEHYGIVREVYADELPLSVEDLLEVDPAGYSKELEVTESLFAAIYDAEQMERSDWAVEQPSMSYRLAVSKVPALTEWFWNGWTEDYLDHTAYGTHLEPADPAPWGAVEAYREYDGFSWMIRWEDRFVRLTAYWELAPEQMAQIAEALCIDF